MTPFEVKNTDDLLTFLDKAAEKDGKQWFGFLQQKMTGIALVHQIAARHADKMTPDEIVDYVKALNNSIYTRMIRGGI